MRQVQFQFVAARRVQRAIPSFLTAALVAAAASCLPGGARAEPNADDQPQAEQKLVVDSAENIRGEREVREAAAQFYVALNAMFTGDIQPMEQVWSHSDDVTYLGPGGDFLVGWAPVLEIWTTQAAMKLGGQVEPGEMRVNMGRDIAVIQNYEQGENTDANGKVQKVSIRATNVFRKEQGQWKMIGHHTDLLPFLKN